MMKSMTRPAFAVVRFAIFPVCVAMFLLLASCSEETKQPVTDQGLEAKEALRKGLLDSAANYDLRVGLSVIELETGDSLLFLQQERFAMQSVYKFPLALAVLDKVERGELSLDHRLFFNKKVLDRYGWSPLKKQNPKSEFTLSVDSVIMYMIAYSDNLACDKLFDLIGGPAMAQNFMRQKGFKDIDIKFTEAQVGEDYRRMDSNACKPAMMSSLLRDFFEGKIIQQNHRDYLLNYMINDSSSHKRILGLLPKEIKVAHKTGTGGTGDTLMIACNDIGIVYLPNGRHLALSVFTGNGHGSYESIERCIAVLSKQVVLYYATKK